MKTVRLEYGSGFMDAEVPDSAVVIRAGEAHEEPEPLANPVAATIEAIRNPLGMGPLSDHVGPGSTVTIAIPDRVKGGVQETAHRRVTMQVVFDELEAAGVRLDDVTLVCAIGLHRKNRLEEFESFLGRETLSRVRTENVVNHDAEDPNGIVDVGPSRHGDPVQMNRLLVDTDLTILLGHTSGNPYGGFSGGYKMPATGLTTWRSIRTHHAPRTMTRPDFIPISTQSHFRDQLRAIGQQMESAMPRPFFSIDAVLDNKSRQLQVSAGAIPDVEQATWPIAHQRTDVTLVGPLADVLIVGMPRGFHYGNGMGSNPLLMMQAIGSSVARASSVLRPNPVVIAASVCDGWFNEDEFPATVAVYDALQKVSSAMELTQFEEEFSTNDAWIDGYRNKFSYHPFHAFSMAYMGGLVRLNTSAVYIAGAKNPGLARGMGGIPVNSVEDGLSEAARIVGGEPRVIVVPELSKPAYHLAPAMAH